MFEGGGRLLAALIGVLALTTLSETAILTPPYFNLATNRRISATATCGEETQGPELYCKLVGANADRDANINLIQGQVCDYCDPSRPDKTHPPEYAVDGAESWWQSPPLSRGMKYNEVNLTIDLGQEFHVAYVFIKMANSPRPGVWVLERSLDNGATYQPWQYFADTISDCEAFFGPNNFGPISSDDSVVCETQYSKVVPLEGGEIVVSLLNNRPSANDFFNSTVLQEWTRATNIRLRFLRTKTLLGHLMSVARQDPTVTRRYFYSIKDISIGGRCVCNGHADTCDITDPNDAYKLLCRCQHNTCGANCDSCCQGYEQKAWRLSKSYKPFICERCNCFGHSEECKYDAQVDEDRLSLDLHGHYDGGGVCQNCRDNTEGVNCHRCSPGYFRPGGKFLNDTDVCQPCDCEFFYSTGNCAEETGQCECKPEFTSPNCDSCSYGYFGYPECRPCECNLNGTRGEHCEAQGGQCPCKQNYGGKFCKECAEGFYNFPECLPCACNDEGSLTDTCHVETGQCTCKSNFGNRTCNQCENGYYNYPNCLYCTCDVRGTEVGVCNKNDGQCLCKEGYGGERCDQCIAGFFGYPNCKPCACSETGSASTICDATGKCTCLYNFAGRTCDQCNPGYYQYPDCKPCSCDSHGAIGVSCDTEGKCQCRNHFGGNRCNQCTEGFYNFPICEDCNCDPTGVLATFGGCGTLPAGELCQCKERVQGRICNECKQLYWNLQGANPEGCEACDCHQPGVMGGLGVCDSKSGQCMCKPSVTSRRCDQCTDGTYKLQEDNLFGCTDCDCDVGGSVAKTCNKETGQCYCRPRINGQTCSEPLQTHYFPTLYQAQYEAEDGRTPANTPVRYGFDQEVFPGYSWKGYAVFSQLQNEIIQHVYINKPSLYRMVLRYINRNPESILGTITITPENPSDIEQKFQVLFKPANTPTLVTVSGATGGIPSPMVMNPGQWAVKINNEKNLLLDYFVLLPAAYYEATILVEPVDRPCEVGNLNLCRQFGYPNLTRFDAVHSDGGFRTEGEQRDPLTEYFTDDKQLSEVNKNRLPLINNNQPEIHLNLQVTKPGKHVLLINYLTPANDKRTSTVNVETSSQRGRDKGSATLYACPYTSVCPQAVIDKHGRVAVFKFDTNFISLVLKGEENSSVAIDSVVAIPLDYWSLDYQQPKSVCVSLDGKCVQALFPMPPDSKRVEFELGNEDQVATVLPRVVDNSTRLIYLDNTGPMIDISGKVPHPGSYVFVVHYYQPDHPEFNLDVLVHNGQVYEAKLPVEHCPSTSGCRSIVKQMDGNDRFTLTENFVFTLKDADPKGVWLDYVLVIPADQYTENVLEEEPVDHTGAFINECGKDHFNIDPSEAGFCRDSVFSLTADYNNGALSCSCDFDGSLSFACEKFGGQCQCRPNVIGRRCEACQTGYYGFPDCRACDCPSTALCDRITGACICPPRVTGERCNQCEALTYGFDPIIGCEECNCEWLGVERGNQQCDLNNGSCKCKDNVVGRTCDRCQAGNWAYPNCQPCDCDLRGTTLDICDQHSAECFCKKNVEGQACDLCQAGTFNIEEKNQDGCTKCFCSGKSARCSSSSTLYRTTVSRMADWTLVTVHVDSMVTLKPLSSLPQQLDSFIGADLTQDEAKNEVVFFAAPEDYLGKRLSSYGGAINYTIFYTAGTNGKAVASPDVIIYSKDLYLLHFALEQPPAAEYYSASVDLIDTNFLLPNGFTASRDQIMQVLSNLEGILIRATYWTDSVTTRLQAATIDVSEEGYKPTATKALSVEHCQCPASYQGLSCEECAPGYYRSQTGPFGGFCVPCQCNGHSDTCDVVTGICSNCKHDTTGDHCEQCSVGHHGNATNGTPTDCLICACPLPIPSNNFATACEVSPHGDRISCECIEGYYGARCESCSAGFFGKPEFAGDYCQPCGCSGNINPEDPSSCDSVTGECLHCLNNTFGEACSLCSPGYYGDAITLKDCQTCDCEECGTKHCDSYNGQCECNPNVIGDKCDRCEVEHYGFASCQGCQPCDCQNATESKQCEDATGQCRCKPGVTGRTCDRCTSGFWNYGTEGCVTCGCNTEYSLGFGCNPRDGQCECLPGVIGEKCDHCPYRWVLIPEDGCFECDSCTHNLLDVTDELQALLSPIVNEFQSVAQGYFTTQRMTYINDTVSELMPQVKLLDPSRLDLLQPITQEVESLEQDWKNLNRRADYSVENGEQSAPKGDKVRKDALEEEKLIKKAVDQARMTVIEVISLASNLDGGTGQQIDSSLQEAEAILEQIKQRDFGPRYDETQAELFKAEELLLKMKEFSMPVQNQSKAFDNLRAEIKKFDDILEDLKTHGRNLVDRANEVGQLNEQNKRSKDNSKVETVKNATKEANNNLKNANALLINATGLLNDARNTFSNLRKKVVAGQENIQQLNETITDKELQLQEVQEPVRKSESHASELVARAGELDNLLMSTRETSTRGIGAAHAYKNIVNGTKEAMKAAQAARNAAENATMISEGLGDRTGESEARSALLLQEARGALHKAQRELEPQLAAAKEQVAHVSNLNKRSEDGDAVINKALNRIPATEELGPLTTKAIEQADAADQVTREALERSMEIIDKLPEEVEKAVQLPKDVTNTNKDLAQLINQMDKMNNVVPNISNLMGRLSEKQAKHKEVGKDVEEQIRKLKEKIAMARNLANMIKVGVTFSPNTVLQLRNPENLPLLGTATRVSTYFKTAKPNGFLLYLGNEVGTQNRIRRTTTDDFMALEIENGYPVLTIDLGSGAERIVSKKYVSDDVWYQAIIDRTGKNVKLIIRAETEGGTEELFTEEQVLQGTKSILNLDQEHSKLFVGGYSNSFDMQKDVKYGSFEGQMEDVMVGDVPVSLWNFEDGANNNVGSTDRDKLVNLQPSTGFRFDGHGYATINSRSYQLRPRSTIQLKFKTFARDGLLFLAGKDRSFISIELLGGHVVYQYNLGHGLLTLTSKETHNNGRWHTVDAVRSGKEGVLKVDGNVEFRDSAPGSATELKISDTLYFGGYPGQHTFKPVTNIDFEGCIDGVQIAETLVDLSQNTRALGVIAGCPVRVASLVAFEESNPGYVRWPNATAPNYLQLNFKFKTTSRGGLLFYATDRNQTSTVSLSLVDGGLVLKSQELELATSPSIKYNDSEWHVVTATHSLDSLRLDIDDYETFRSESAPRTIHIAYGSMFFGGIPDTYTIAPGRAASDRPFIGCLGDATVNGVFINFANATDRIGAILGKCKSDERVITSSKPSGKLPINSEEEDVDKPMPEVTEPTDLEPVDGENEIEGSAEGTTLVPTLPTPAPTPVGQCVLPLHPATDPDISADSGYRFGNVVPSRIEYDNMPDKYKNKYNFSMEFKTLKENGIMFYVADERHIDSIALFMKDGQVHYTFNLGSGPAQLSTEMKYNDGEWHTILFGRQLKTGRMVIDDTEVVRGESKGATKTMNVDPPFYLGGIAPNITEDAKIVMKNVNVSFEGCIRHFKMNGRLVEPPKMPPIGVVACSEKTEQGVYFSANGGYIKARNIFRVGFNIDIKMDIKPRNVSGVLLAVHSRYDYLALQMVNGAIKFSVENGKGAISATFNPPNDHYFCDGQWHTIQAVKAKNVVTLSVDTIHTDHSIGVPGSSSTDTRNPLYIGGLPQNSTKVKGMETREQYVGCMKNIMINDELEKFEQVIGDVFTSVCPTI